MINLLPPEAKARLARRRFNSRLIKIVIVLLALEIAGVGILWSWQQTAQETRDLIEERVASLRLNLKSFDNIREQAALIADRAADYQALQKNLIDWPAVLSDLAAATPADMTLSSFKTTPVGNTLTVTISGEAGSRASVIAFRQSLENSPTFAAMVFDSSTLIDSQSGRVSFNLTGKLETKTPEAEKPK